MYGGDDGDDSDGVGCVRGGQRRSSCSRNYSALESHIQKTPLPHNALMSRGDEFVNTMNTSLEDVMDGHRRTKILIVSTADKATKHGRQMDISKTMKLLEELPNVYGNNTNQWLAGGPLLRLMTHQNNPPKAFPTQYS
ncbi:unnamed protein product [Nippostrongylus brasiliensis]|uniref:Kinesin motor domain-containing protein n=1 Tax=Nippostrongylus brasiliensis TaxID=27835 RepID=A0A0N4YB35_NIPBR|nr:unnamed protein product [Nippostrongylus brasiliensis]